MLIKRNSFMATKAHSVKKIGVSLISTLTICTAAIAPNAFAGDTLIVDKTVTVKLKTAELKSEAGIQKAYAKLKKRAKSSCRADSHALYYLGTSVRECAEDLVEQFVVSADIAELKALHLSKTSTVKTQKYTLNNN